VDVGEEAGIPGSGSIVVETREIGPFDSITLIGEGSVVITQGDTASLTIEADDNLLQYLETRVVSDTLQISTTANTDIAPTEGPVYRVAVPELVLVELIGVGEIRTASWQADQFTISMRGVGDIWVDALTTASLSVDVGGVGSVTVSGTAGTQTVTVAGLSEYVAGSLESQSADVTCADASSAELWVTDTLDIEITGTGTVSYYGSPTVTEDAGMGTVEPLGER
jgi:hypothetical protein